MLDFSDDPAFVRDLFEFVVALGLRFAEAQIARELMTRGTYASFAGRAVPYDELRELMEGSSAT